MSLTNYWKSWMMKKVKIQKEKSYSSLMKMKRMMRKRKMTMKKMKGMKNC
jgi:hypothetical protein